MKKYQETKEEFSNQLSGFASTLVQQISQNDEWTIKGFIDVFRNIYSLTSDTKVISKILELHLLPHFLLFANSMGYEIELASHQNWYPDLTFVSIHNPLIKFAVDLKTTYKLESYPEFCNGFTLGSHGEYFINRESSKNIQYPYNQYSGHFCLGIIYSRTKMENVNEMHMYTVDEVETIPSVIGDFTFFAVEKWRIASDKGGSGNTANIGSIHKIDDILTGNGVFAKAGEEIFDDYWANFGKILLIDSNGKRKVISTLKDYLEYRQLPSELNNPRALRRKVG